MPKCISEECLPHLTSGVKLGQEHPVLDVLSGMNQGGQTSWVVACSVKFSSRRSRENQVAFIALNLKLHTKFKIIQHPLYLGQDIATALELHIY